MTAAIVSPLARKRSRTACRSLKATVSVSAASAAGTPLLSGTPNVAPPEPAFTSRLSACPW
jgi:hypothetical protein